MSAELGAEEGCCFVEGIGLLAGTFVLGRLMISATKSGAGDKETLSNCESLLLS